MRPIGVYSQVTLVEVSNQRDEVKKLLVQNKDPRKKSN